MTIGTAYGSVLIGLDSRVVKITATVNAPPTSGPALAIRGLTETAAREARIRVRSALAASGIETPEGSTVDVAIDTDGGPELAEPALDLPIAVAILRASGSVIPGDKDAIALPKDTGEDTVFVGELALSGNVRPVRGALARTGGLDVARSPFVFAPGNAWEAGLGRADNVRIAATLKDLIEGRTFRADHGRLAPHSPSGREDLPPSLRAVFDACQGKSRILLVGPPGSGTSMIARRLASEAAPLSGSERLDVVRIQGAAGLIGEGASPFSPVVGIPLRAPHHTVSEVGLLGGGVVPRPGEVTLAHHGVLFLDEITEFRRSTLDALAHALRERRVQVARKGTLAAFPAVPRYVVASACPAPSPSCPTRRSYEDRIAWIVDRFGFVRVEVPMFDARELSI